MPAPSYRRQPPIIKRDTSKLGGTIGTISRPVGPSCPEDCPFLGNACYAERIQNRRPNVKRSWETTAFGCSDWGDWETRLERELRKGFQS